MGRAFNPNFGGLVGHVWLHLPGKVYQTYPLYNNLQTTGIYVYPSNFSSVTRRAGNLTVNVESQVRNESGAAQMVTLSADVIDPNSGAAVATIQSAATRSAATDDGRQGERALTGAGSGATSRPNLYRVVSKLRSMGRSSTAARS